MLPVQAIELSEKATIAMYQGIVKHPNIGRLSCLFVSAAAALTPTLRLLAATIESLALVFIHLVGTLLSKPDHTLTLAATCFVLFLWNGVTVVLTPAAGMVHGVKVLFETIFNTKSNAYKRIEYHTTMYETLKTVTFKDYWKMTVNILDGY